MSRFQSHLFNWIDRSLPVSLGRRARRWYERFARELQQQIRETSQYVAATLLYPAYQLSQAVQRRYPRLGTSSTELPPLLKPVRGALLRVDRAYGTVRISQTSIQTSGQTSSPLPYDANQNLWESSESSPDRNGPATQFHRLHRLLAAAIAYFFGEKPPREHWHGQERENRLLRPVRELLLRIERTYREGDIESGGHFSEVAPHPRGTTRPDTTYYDTTYYERQLERLRRLIAAAIAYFFGKKPSRMHLQDDKPRLEKGTEAGSEATALPLHPVRELLFWFDRTYTSVANSHSLPDRAIASQQSLDPVAYDPQLQRFMRLIAAAIDHFFGRKSSHKLSPEDEHPWVTMADLFGDETGPWPIPAEADSMQLYASLGVVGAFDPGAEILPPVRPDTATLVRPESSGSIASPTPPPLGSNTERPMRAWIETPATFLGYAYSPIFDLLMRLDRAIARFEQWLIAAWHKLVRGLRKLFRLSTDKP